MNILSFITILMQIILIYMTILLNKFSHILSIGLIITIIFAIISFLPIIPILGFTVSLLSINWFRSRHISLIVLLRWSLWIILCIIWHKTLRMRLRITLVIVIILRRWMLLIYICSAMHIFGRSIYLHAVFV